MLVAGVKSGGDLGNAGGLSKKRGEIYSITRSRYRREGKSYLYKAY